MHLISLRLFPSASDAASSNTSFGKSFGKRLILALVLPGLLLAAPVATACTRDDVKFYLDKGFTQAQIASLCGEGGPSSKDYRAFGRAEEEAYRRGLERREYEDDTQVIRTSLDAGNVVLSRKYLEYTSATCMRVINQPDVEARGKICPDVRYRIHLRGLNIRGFDRRFFIAGQREIKVSGKIQRKLTQSINDYPRNVRLSIRRSFNEDKNKRNTAIPILKDSSVKRVMEILRERIKEANVAAARQNQRPQERP